MFLLQAEGVGRGEGVRVTKGMEIDSKMFGAMEATNGSRMGALVRSRVIIARGTRRDRQESGDQP